MAFIPQVVNFPGLADSIGGIGEGFRNRRLNRVFSNGLPKDETGAIDYAMASDMLAKAGFTKEALALNDSYLDGFGGNDKMYAPKMVWDPKAKKFKYIQFGEGGGPGIDTGYDPVSRWDRFTTPRGDTYYSPSMLPPSGPLSGPEHRNDENAAGGDWTTPPPPSGETDPQADIDLPADIYTPARFSEPQEEGPVMEGDSGITMGDPDGPPMDMAEPGGPTLVMPGDRAEEHGRQSGKEIEYKTKAAYPGFIEEIKKSLQLLDNIADSPNLDSVLGMFQGNAQPRWAQSQSQTATQSKIDQVVAKQYLMAYEKLRGAGAITENETKAAQQAVSRLTAQGMSPEAYRAAINDLKRDLIDLVNVARAKGKLGPNFKNPFAHPTPKGGRRGITAEEWLGM